jgi:hypothetical protein
LLNSIEKEELLILVVTNVTEFSKKKKRFTVITNETDEKEARHNASNLKIRSNCTAFTLTWLQCKKSETSHHLFQRREVKQTRKKLYIKNIHRGNYN